ncbi:MAG: DUF1499 domain-containing protein [Limnothrix sp. RL_2_0]|nr:DUF1499 domain-containing protein [Limnothrix sp. RL_2_0]
MSFASAHAFRVFALFVACCLWLTNPTVSHAAALFPGNTPTNLGVQDGHLSACPSSPNCVVSQGVDPDHTIEPLTYVGDRQVAYQALLQVLSIVPRTEVVTQTDDYIRTESSSRLMGFVDDAEFYFPSDEPVIQMRSASRLGESDLGVNQRRLEQIRLAMQDLGIVSKK